MRFCRLILVLCVTALGAWAALSGAIRGRVVDPSGQPVPGASVIATDVATGAALRVHTDARGRFLINGVDGHTYAVKVTTPSFVTYLQTVTVTAGSPVELQAKLTLGTVVQSVMVRAGAVQGATATPTQATVFKSSQSLRVLDRDQINALSPVAGAAQILAVAPGVNVTGFGDTGATKSTISLNGIQQGWGGYGGYTTAGDAAITFDGIPVHDAATGLWQSNMFPQAALFNSATVTYGPGNPVNRWQNNVAGGIEYTPLQPSNRAHFAVTQTVGDYAEENTFVEATSGVYDGWSAVVAGGHGSGNSFRQSPDGFKNPQGDYALYGKAIKDLPSGDFDLGYYYSYGHAYRAQVIPTSAVGVTIDGTPTGEPYSQQSSGFYSTVPFDSYEKYDTNQMALVWTKLNVGLDPTTVLHNSLWFERINRLHSRQHDIFDGDNGNGSRLMEWNNPFTKTYGDQLWVQKVLPDNTITAGTWYMHTLYNARNNFFNPADGGSAGGVVNNGGMFRSSYFNQDMYTLFIQDQIRPINWLTITPGIRYLNNQIAYTNGVPTDFTFAPGVVPYTHCAIDGSTTTGTKAADGNITKEQSSTCDATEQRGGVEPSINMAVRPANWLSLYGGYSTELRTPALGGGGGMFQNVDPNSYYLATAEYSQAGAKLHFDQVGSLSNVLVGISYYHLLFKNQEVDISLANGGNWYASATSRYNGVNWYFDASPISRLQLFANSTFERALYNDWSIGGFQAGTGVPYVPNAILNIGSQYTIPVTENVVVQPRLWYQYTGSQTIFDNNQGLPSTQSMPSFGTINLGANIPVDRFDFRVTALNITNKKYNQFEWISSGGYLGGNPGYTLAYPGAPFSIYGSASIHF